jgi:hypothetical protein
MEEEEDIETQLTSLQISLKAQRQDIVEKYVHVGQKVIQEVEQHQSMHYPPVDYTSRDIRSLKDTVNSCLSSNSLLNKHRPPATTTLPQQGVGASATGMNATDAYFRYQNHYNTSKGSRSTSHCHERSTPPTTTPPPPLLTTSSSAQDWDNQALLRALAKSLGIKAGGTNDDIRKRIQDHGLGKNGGSNTSAGIPTMNKRKRKRKYALLLPNVFGKTVLLQQGYHVNQKHLGKKAVVQGTEELSGGWMEVGIMHDDGTLTGEVVLWRRRAMVIQDEEVGTTTTKKSRKEKNAHT